MLVMIQLMYPDKSEQNTTFMIILVYNYRLFHDYFSKLE